MNTATQQPTIWLQGLGECTALPVEEIKPGALLSWNYAWREYRAVSIAKVTKCFFALTEENIKTGQQYTRRVKAGRLIAACNP